jgi:long-subunit fatty acid transport protein
MADLKPARRFSIDPPHNLSKSVKTLLILALLLVTEKSWGVSYSDNRGLFPIGEVESFMANTGVALSGSTGAVYYNPAGLASLEQNHISLSANLYMNIHSEQTPIETIDGVDLDYSTSGLQSIPDAFVSVGKWNDWHYAFSVLIPEQIQTQSTVLFTTPSYPTIQLSGTNSIQLLMVGFSAARRTEYDYDLGFGCFYSMYQTTQDQSFTGEPASATKAAVIYSYYNAQVNGVLCNLGMQKQATPDLRWGFTARLPLTPTSKQGTATQFVQDPTSGNSQSTGPESVNADYQIPADFSLGFEYRLSDSLKTYLDISYQLASSYNTGDIGAADLSNHAVARASLGVDYKMYDTFHLYAGAGYNPSSVNADEDNAAEDFMIGTLGGRWINGNSNMGLGVLYAKSNGHKIGHIYNAALQDLGTEPASVNTTAVGLMVNSGYVF